MGHLNFWLHMNGEYMWRWFCSKPSGVVQVASARSFFCREDALAAMEVARSCIGSAPTAA
jgi:hypothetical protein